MIHTKDLTKVILFSVVAFFTHSWVGQLPYLITGIPGIGYYLIIVHTILYSVAALLFEGRRWRLFFMTALIMLLTFPLHMGGPPYDVVSRIPLVTSSLVYDIIFNSLYGMFKRKDKLGLWAILGVSFHFMFGTLLAVPVNMLFYTPDIVLAMFNATSAFLPVILIEAVIGGYVGCQIYRRVQSIG